MSDVLKLVEIANTKQKEEALFRSPQKQIRKIMEKVNRNKQRIKEIEEQNDAHKDHIEAIKRRARNRGKLVNIVKDAFR